MLLQMILRFFDSLLILVGVVLTIIGFSGVLNNSDYCNSAAMLLAGGVAMIAVGAYIWRHKRKHAVSNGTKTTS